jgi:hypothetical protein
VRECTILLKQTTCIAIIFIIERVPITRFNYVYIKNLKYKPYNLLYICKNWITIDIKRERERAIQVLKIDHITLTIILIESRGPVRIPVRIDPPQPLVCRKRRLNGAVLRMRPEKPKFVV